MGLSPRVLTPGTGLIKRPALTRRIEIVLVLPPSPEPLLWSAPACSFAKRVTRGVRPACEADIEGVPGSRV
jgi:hypothetical protein